MVFVRQNRLKHSRCTPFPLIVSLFPLVLLSSRLCFLNTLEDHYDPFTLFLSPPYYPMTTTTRTTQLTSEYLFYKNNDGHQLGIGSYAEDETGVQKLSIVRQDADGSPLTVVKVLSFGDATGDTLDLSRYITVGDKLLIGLDVSTPAYQFGHGCLDFIEGDSNTSTKGYFQFSNTVEAPEFFATSDKRLKTHLQPLHGPEVLNKLATLTSYSYQWKDARMPKPTIGLVAQEVEPVFPELVKEVDCQENERVVEGDTGQTKKVVNYLGMVAVLVEAVNALRGEVAVLREEVGVLRAREGTV